MSQSFWTQLLARLSVPMAKLMAATNPDNPGHWLRKDFILREAELDLSHWHFTLRDNPSLTEKFIRDLHVENMGLQYRRRVLGEWCRPRAPSSTCSTRTATWSTCCPS